MAVITIKGVSRPYGISRDALKTGTLNWKKEDH